MNLANGVPILLILFVGFPDSTLADHHWDAQRNRMVATQIENRGVEDVYVLSAMKRVPRHLFVDEKLQRFAYTSDSPLPIGSRQTISQPYIVAMMTELLEVEPGDVVLEIGTGSGYQAAVLAEIVGEVYSVEIIEALGLEAIKRLKALDYENIHVKIGDGYKGWHEFAPYDGIIVTAAPDHIPQPLVDQLKVGARMLIPLGPESEVQYLTVVEKNLDGSYSQNQIELVRFVPLTRNKEKS